MRKFIVDVYEIADSDDAGAEDKLLASHGPYTLKEARAAAERVRGNSDALQYAIVREDLGVGNDG